MSGAAFLRIVRALAPRRRVIIPAMGTIKDQGIVLRRLDYSESSQVLAVFTRHHGKARILAKGVKRSTKTRFAAAIDLLEIGHVVLSVRGPRQDTLAPLVEWTQSRVLGGLRGRLDRLYGAQYAAALTADLTEDWDPHPPLFDALAQLLLGLNTASDTLPLVVAFQRRLLEEIGSIPIFNACVSCGRPMPCPGEVHFSSLEGGLVCRDCEPVHTEKVGVEPTLVDWLVSRRGDAGPPARSAWVLFDYHLTHLMGRPLPIGRMYLAAC
jgi:DNA repair protein RecO (recombination protein O)